MTLVIREFSYAHHKFGKGCVSNELVMDSRLRYSVLTANKKVYLFVVNDDNTKFRGDLIYTHQITVGATRRGSKIIRFVQDYTAPSRPYTIIGIAAG